MSYLNRKAIILSNSTSARAIDSIQNFYTSFCKNPTENPSESSSEDDEDENQDVPNVVDVMENIDIETDSDVSSSNSLDDSDLLSDSFVSKLAAFSESPLQLQLSSRPSLVSIGQATTAVIELTQSHRKPHNLTLQSTTCLEDFDSSVTEPNDSESSKTTNVCSKTRIDLLENIERALTDRNCTNTTADSSEPARMAVDFPTIQQQSLHWKLNEKQNMAFMLIATALLQHIFTVNAWCSRPMKQNIKCLK